MKSILLIGLGRFGKHIALHLNHLGHQVMAVDTSAVRFGNKILRRKNRMPVWGSSLPGIISGTGSGCFLERRFWAASSCS